MKNDPKSGMAAEIMERFAVSTGVVSSEGETRRYLWTDAFAVCNFLELYLRTEDAKWLDLALLLIDQVHHALGRHRPDAEHAGWISGLSESEGEEHPTQGGLRIGKELPERKADEPLNERLEWERDGQYYHYLTKWMHALNRVSSVTGDSRYLRWATELAQSAHASFSYLPAWGGGKRLYWKMSIDLSRPQVPSMGQHDPLDGLVTCCELQRAANSSASGDLPSLKREIAELSAMCAGKELATDDALGIGGLVCNACAMVQLAICGGFSFATLLPETIDAALAGLEVTAANHLLQMPSSYRLPFRELGLAIGLEGVGLMSELVEKEARFFKGMSLQPRLLALSQHVAMALQIQNFWLNGKNRGTGNWTEHEDINSVMLATSLVPTQFLTAF